MYGAFVYCQALPRWSPLYAARGCPMDHGKWATSSAVESTGLDEKAKNLKSPYETLEQTPYRKNILAKRSKNKSTQKQQEKRNMKTKLSKKTTQKPTWPLSLWASPLLEVLRLLWLGEPGGGAGLATGGVVDAGGGVQEGHPGPKPEGTVGGLGIERELLVWLVNGQFWLLASLPKGILKGSYFIFKDFEQSEMSSCILGHPLGEARLLLGTFCLYSL